MTSERWRFREGRMWGAGRTAGSPFPISLPLDAPAESLLLSYGPPAQGAGPSSDSVTSAKEGCLRVSSHPSITAGDCPAHYRGPAETDRTPGYPVGAQ